MYGQLNAIAREYNFPSIMGLCLYLHINENGITMAPRISEDSWQYAFGHLFETRPPSGSQQLPIFGRIEFDIDLNKARWFDAWISGILRDSDPFLPVVASEASLAAHQREESLAMRVDELPAEDQWNTSSHTLVAEPRPETLRYLPKKLSLVDRLDSHSLHIPPKLQSHSHHPDFPHTHEFAALSPVPQLGIPQVAKSELARHTNSWQETTELCPVSKKETQQLAVVDVGESAGVMDVGAYSLERNFQQSVNINKHLWPITSAEPDGLIMKSPIASPRLSSIHFDRRADRTTPTTPTTMTSWGPPDDEWCSVVSDVSRLPSPDIGERVIEDVLAPRPRAVWGNSFGWHSAMTWRDVYPFSATQTASANRAQVQDPSGFMPQVICKQSLSLELANV